MTVRKLKGISSSVCLLLAVTIQLTIWERDWLEAAWQHTRTQLPTAPGTHTHHNRHVLSMHTGGLSASLRGTTAH